MGMMPPPGTAGVPPPPMHPIGGGGPGRSNIIVLNNEKPQSKKFSFKSLRRNHTIDVSNDNNNQSQGKQLKRKSVPDIIFDDFISPTLHHHHHQQRRRSTDIWYIRSHQNVLYIPLLFSFSLSYCTFNHTLTHPHIPVALQWMLLSRSRINSLSSKSHEIPLPFLAVHAFYVCNPSKVQFIQHWYFFFFMMTQAEDTHEIYKTANNTPSGSRRSSRERDTSDSVVAIMDHHNNNEQQQQQHGIKYHGHGAFISILVLQVIIVCVLEGLEIQQAMIGMSNDCTMTLDVIGMSQVGLVYRGLVMAATFYQLMFGLDTIQQQSTIHLWMLFINGKCVYNHVNSLIHSQNLLLSRSIVHHLCGNPNHSKLKMGNNDAGNGLWNSILEPSSLRSCITCSGGLSLPCARGLQHLDASSHVYYDDSSKWRKESKDKRNHCIDYSYGVYQTRRLLLALLCCSTHTRHGIGWWTKRDPCRVSACAYAWDIDAFHDLVQCSKQKAMAAAHSCIADRLGSWLPWLSYGYICTTPSNRQRSISCTYTSYRGA